MIFGQKCNIIRGAKGATVRYGYTESNIWTTVLKDQVCRLDFIAQERSRSDEVTEEMVGRNQGLLFLNSDVAILPRDIIIIQGDPLYADKQYDVLYVDQVMGRKRVHHLEVTVQLRDNEITIAA